jgi:ABC-type transport system involved in multi-copper enzyme maturation permease subunit
MEIVLTTNAFHPHRVFASGSASVFWKAWRESRGRFVSALMLLASFVLYAVVTSPGFLSRYNARFPDKTLLYSVYVWTGLFHYALQGLWVLGAFIVGLGGLAREKATGVALFMLGLPVSRRRLFLIRASVAWAESIAFGLVSAMLIPVLSAFVGESYPFLQALVFGASMAAAGLVIIAFGLFLSEVFEGEFTSPVVGLCTLATIFLGYRAHTLHGWNVFDVMSAATSIDPKTQLLMGTFDWFGMTVCFLIAAVLLCTTGAVIQARDF